MALHDFLQYKSLSLNDLTKCTCNCRLFALSGHNQNVWIFPPSPSPRKGCILDLPWYPSKSPAVVLNLRGSGGDQFASTHRPPFLTSHILGNIGCSETIRSSICTGTTSGCSLSKGPQHGTTPAGAKTKQPSCLLLMIIPFSLRQAADSCRYSVMVDHLRARNTLENSSWWLGGDRHLGV